MTTIARLVQGSPEWQEHRLRYRNASETPVVLGVSPWQTPYQLWQLKLGLTKPEITPPMLHGVQLEPAARACYERKTGEVMQPLVMVDGDYSASLDGVTLAGTRILEIKCPYKGRESALWHAAVKGELPEHYRWQLQHQLMVTKAEIADVFVFDGSEGVLLQIEPTPDCWPRIGEAWDAFCALVAQRSPPPLTKGDVRERDDPEWQAAAESYISAKRAMDQVQRTLDEAKAALVALTTHSSESGSGVTVTRYWKRGSIDYARIPQLEGVTLEDFRRQPTMENRVMVTRENWDTKDR